MSLIRTKFAIGSNLKCSTSGVSWNMTVMSKNTNIFGGRYLLPLALTASINLSSDFELVMTTSGETCSITILNMI